MTTASKYVQYGCGLSAPETWTNFDASFSLRLQKIRLLRKVANPNGPEFPSNVKYGNIVKGLPVNDASCSAIYCSHVPEHLSLNSFRRAIENTYRYLKSGGTFRCVLPDLEQLCREYLASADEQASIRFMESSYLGVHNRAESLSGFAREWLGNSKHLWMWDERSLKAELARVGFIDIRRASYGDSAIEAFKDVEDPGRWEGSVGIDCRKPG